ncbi:50S ribosomal protein L20 [Blastocystis sp. subtype 4]|uniref:50S ribosomal protein L20 n=1 Tax=Blastocystis sp. subtype 4 TaxID=944170 RepID=UPI000711E53A|nr:50S ribosomal protein L20 [Blastocystis sp. subtype 4]KNB43469.1 50S ribosomal protein L20 [Blastocystis sp. subtype 4]|eukprot:XP_014526912.1 50S ribosomal protein L20 [Blastocystis sp. subtype 4]
MRSLWIQRINAASRLCGTTYRDVIHDEKEANILLNRKMLAELAVTEPCSYNSVVCAFKVLKENGVLQEEPPVKLPDHAPVEDVNALIAEMNKVSI